MILVVDDDEASAELTRRRLSKVGVPVQVQVGPFGSLGGMRNGQYRVVILDVDMPALPGTAILQLLHEGASPDRAKVLLYSSLEERTLRQLAEKHQADAYLSKTAPREQLVAKVNALLGRPARTGTD